MDGTLVETEQYWGEALFEPAAASVARCPRPRAERTVGSSMRTAMAVLYDDLGVTRTEEQLRADARWVEDSTAGLLARASAGGRARAS